MANKQTLLAFIERINAHDVDGLTDLMSDDHAFIDARGNEIVGKEKMTGGWRSYFEWFPDYKIEVTDVFENDEEFGLFGFAGGSFKRQPDASWRLPAAWKAVVKDGRVTLWQVLPIQRFRSKSSRILRGTRLCLNDIEPRSLTRFFLLFGQIFHCDHAFVR